jgi:Protein of unknown function (DUF2905)
MLKLQIYFANETNLMSPQTGKYVMLAGAIIFLSGLIIYFFHNKLHWIGHLPGDIRVERENFRFYFPITTMIIFSILLTLIFQVIKKLM